jgi:hypothetical protein
MVSIDKQSSPKVRARSVHAPALRSHHHHHVRQCPCLRSQLLETTNGVTAPCVVLHLLGSSGSGREHERIIYWPTTGDTVSCPI